MSAPPPAPPEPRFPDAYRRSIGVTLARLGELVREARGYGLTDDRLDRIEEELEATADTTAARRPRAPRNLANAVLVQML